MDWSADEAITISNIESGDKVVLGRLYKCTGKAFPTAIFEKYSNISAATLTCQIQSISSPELESARRLTSLELQRNEIGRIQARTFEHLDQATRLDLSYNSIATLEDYAFSGMSALEELSLANNNLTTLNKNAFSGATKLRSISLASNDISSIEVGTFDWPQSNVSELDLSRNQLTELHDNLFSGMAELRTIKLAENKLATLKKNIFAGVLKLKAIDLEKNSLTTIEAGAFDLPEVIEINLKHNPLSSLPDNLFANAPKMQRLILIQTDFTKFPSALLQPSVAIEELAFSVTTMCEVIASDLAMAHKLRVATLLGVDLLPPATPGEEKPSALVEIFITGNRLTNNILNHLAPLRNLEHIRFGSSGNIKNVTDLEKVREIFPNIKDITILEYDFDCDWARIAASALQLNGVSLWVVPCPVLEITSDQ